MGFKRRTHAGDPFPFVGHGVGFARKHIECYIGFSGAVPPADRSAIEAGCPPPLAVFFEWTERGLCFGSDDGLSSRIQKTYPGKPILGMPGTEQWRALAAAVETWVRAVHGRWSIAYVIWPLDYEIGHNTDDWHDRSVALIPSQILPDLHGKPDKFARWYADNVARLWRSEMQKRPAAAQAQALAAVPDAARSALLALDLLWEPVDPAPVDDRRELDKAEAVRLWRSLSGPFDDVEAALQLAQAEMFPNTKPVDARWTLAWSIQVEGTPEDGLKLCDAMLAASAPGDWLALRAQFLCRAGRPAEAEPLIPAALLDHLLAGPAHSDNHALVALHEYYAAIGDSETAAVVIHGGAPLGSFLKLMARVAGCSVPERAPPRSGSRFAELLDRWLDPVWQPESLSDDDRWRCLRKLEKLPKRPLADKCASLESAGNG